MRYSDRLGVETMDSSAWTKPSKGEHAKRSQANMMTGNVLANVFPQLGNGRPASLPRFGSAHSPAHIAGCRLRRNPSHEQSDNLSVEVTSIFGGLLIIEEHITGPSPLFLSRVLIAVHHEDFPSTVEIETNTRFDYLRAVYCGSNRSRRHGGTS